MSDENDFPVYGTLVSRIREELEARAAYGQLCDSIALGMDAFCEAYNLALLVPVYSEYRYIDASIIKDDRIERKLIRGQGIGRPTHFLLFGMKASCDHSLPISCFRIS